MQLAKMMKGDSARTLRRKLDDMALALSMEQHLPKEEILRLYADYAYFGHNVYGLKNACRYYFARPGCEGLSLAEAAYLVGLVKAPTAYGTDPEKGKLRRDVVLTVALGPEPPPLHPSLREFVRWYGKHGYAEFYEREILHKDMLAQKYGRDAILAAMFEPLRFAYDRGSDDTPYVRDAAVSLVADKLGEERMKRGAQVSLTINENTQHMAELALAEALEQAEVLGAEKDLDGGVVVLDAKTGNVLALVGGRDYGQSQVPFALRPIQVGSAIKPLVYSEGFEEGIIKPGEKVVDTPFCIGGWCPKNYGNKYYGHLPVEDALSHSLNSVAVRIASKIGAETLYERFRELGFRSPLSGNLTMALGASEVSMLELAQAYTALLDGEFKRARLIARADDRAGTVLYVEPQAEPIRVFQPETVADTREAMRRVLLPGGTGVRLGQGLSEGWKVQGAETPPQMACKTGTTNDSLRVGMMCLMSDSDLGTPVILAVYMGYQRPRPLGEQATGGRLAGPAMQRLVLGLSRERTDYGTFAAYNQRGPVETSDRAPLPPAQKEITPPAPVTYAAAGDNWLHDLYDLHMPPGAWNELTAPLHVAIDRKERFTEKLRGEDWHSGSGFDRAVSLGKKLVRFVAVRGFGRESAGQHLEVNQDGGFAVIDEQPDRIVTQRFAARSDVKKVRVFVSGGQVSGLDLITAAGEGESYVRLKNQLRKAQNLRVVVDRGALGQAWRAAGLDEHDLGELRNMVAGTDVNLDAIRRGFEINMLMVGRTIIAVDIKSPTASGGALRYQLGRMSQGTFDTTGHLVGRKLWPIVADEVDTFAVKRGTRRTLSDGVFRAMPNTAVVSPTRAFVIEVDDDAHRIKLESSAGYPFTLSGVRTRAEPGDVFSSGQLIGIVDSRGYLTVRAEAGLPQIVTLRSDETQPSAAAFVSQYLRQLDFAAHGPKRRGSGNSFATL
jgi:membrane peptidoglycan carboxypeptidase